MLEQMKDAAGIQVFSDGGYQEGHGAAAFAVALIQHDGHKFISTMIGARACPIAPARSAFQAEVAALDLAIEFLIHLAARSGMTA